MKRERPFLDPAEPVSDALREAIEAGWQRYRRRGHTRDGYARLLVPMLVAMIRVFAPWARLRDGQ
jgi:hypothetical protein